MKVLIASDSYKGSLSSIEVAAGMKEGICRVYPDAEVIHVQVGDGGEGTVDALIGSLGGKFYSEAVHGPDGKIVNAKYGILPDGKAVIEMAAASGLTLVPEKERDVMKASSYGFGELIKAVLDRGCKEIYVGIGGSATNDGGAGMAQALGISLRDSSGVEIGPGGGALERLSNVDFTHADPRLRETKIFVICDVTNPLYGENGASAVYGPQKGAGPELVAVLDRNLKHYADVVENATGREFRMESGAGAAGGVGFGMVCLLDAELKHGIQVILDAIGINKKMEWADIVLTGEGRIDSQSACGKVIDGVSVRAARYGKPVIAISGSLEKNLGSVYEMGISSLEAAVCRPMSLETACRDAKTLVADATERVMRTVLVGQRLGG